VNPTTEIAVAVHRRHLQKDSALVATAGSVAERGGASGAL
jgi:hypothetical protein